MEKMTAKEIREEIDKEKVHALGKKRSHHLTRITGSRNPIEYVVCTDGTEIPYTKAEEERFIAALESEKPKRKVSV